MVLIYVAGPYRALTAWLIEENIRRAEQAGLAIAKAGGIPIIPHSMYRFFQGEVTEKFWLDATLEILRACDGAFFIDGWENSLGSTAEDLEATKQGIPKLGQKHREHLNEWIQRLVKIKSQAPQVL